MEQIGMSPLSSLSSLSGAVSSHAAKQAGTDFSGILSDMLEQYDQVDRESEYASLNLLSGNTDDLSGALIATEKSEIALNLTVAIRNKAVDAYKEIMNMQV